MRLYHLSRRAPKNSRMTWSEGPSRLTVRWFGDCGCCFYRTHVCVPTNISKLPNFQHVKALPDMALTLG